MNLINTLERIWITIRIMLYAASGLSPIAGGIWALYKSQTEYFTQSYQEDMYFGIGITSLIIGLFVFWAYLVRIVYLVRYNNTINNKS